jgi:hypothetical protein
MTAQQREDESRLRNALYQIEQDESLSPEERQEARRRVIGRMAGMDLIPTRTDPSPYAPGQEPGKHWYDKEYGGWLMRDTKGNIKELPSAGLDISEAWKIALELSHDEKTGLPDINKARELVPQLMGPGAAGPETPETPPITEIGEGIQEIDTALTKIEGDPRMSLEQHLGGYKRVALDDVTDIATAKRQIEIERLKIAAEEKSYKKDIEEQRKHPPPSDMAPQYREDYFEKRKKKSQTRIDALEIILKDLTRERDKILLFSDLYNSANVATK